MSTKKVDGAVVDAYDTNSDGQADYFTTHDASGRIVRIGYDITGAGRSDQSVALDAIPMSACRHVIFILDGFGYDTVEAYQREGHLGLFYAPRRVISTFPPMTELALDDVFHAVRSLGYESVYYDHRANRIVGGDNDYISLAGEGWVRAMAYRANVLLDPAAYILPDVLFNQELSEVAKLFDRRDRKELPIYLVSTAGMSTRHGLEGQRQVLAAIDRLSQEMVWKTRGMVKITLFSDHGHTLTECVRLDFRKYLSEKGWRIVTRLEGPRDVALMEFGLITYEAFATRDPPALAATVLQHPGVDLVTYPDGEAVIVEKTDGRARVERRGERYRSVAEKGDPLELADIVAKMKADSVMDKDGFAEDAEWFKRTVMHRYPDAPNRLWRAFNSLVENPADLIASLKPQYYAGLAAQAFWVPVMASTHGSLDRRDSIAFIMSTAGPLLPPDTAIRSRDLSTIFEKLDGNPWPPHH